MGSFAVFWLASSPLVIERIYHGFICYKEIKKIRFALWQTRIDLELVTREADAFAGVVHALLRVETEQLSDLQKDILKKSAYAAAQVAFRGRAQRLQDQAEYKNVKVINK